LPFAFKRMRVYQMARELAAEIHEVVVHLDRSCWRSGDQLMRASLSIMLNIAEGAGEFRKLEKARFYRMARRSCYETCSAVDHLRSVGVLPPAQAAAYEQRLDHLAASLTSLVHSMESR
jgi:four helix bundle protein